MSIHPDYRNKKILNYVTDLIIDYDYNHYADFSQADKEGLVALLIDADGRMDEFCCITDSTHSDETINLFKKALDGTQEDNERFLEAIKANAVHYYDRVMEELFYDVLSDYEQARHEWLDYMAKHGDPDEAYDRYREGLA